MAMAAHHMDIDWPSLEAMIVQSADAISAARPGARRDILESYVKRLEKLEGIADSFEGVSKAFALQAGREIRIMVESEKITDEEAVWLSKDIARRIENELEYPGQIKVTVIRETRAVEYARGSLRGLTVGRRATRGSRMTATVADLGERALIERIRARACRRRRPGSSSASATMRRWSAPERNRSRCSRPTRWSRTCTSTAVLAVLRRRPQGARRQPERSGGDGRRRRAVRCSRSRCRRRRRSPTSTRSSGGLLELAREHRVTLLGGNITRSPGPARRGRHRRPGRCTAARILTRGGAKPGDELFVSGTIGAAAAGLAVAARAVRAGRQPSSSPERPRRGRARAIAGRSRACGSATRSAATGGERLHGPERRPRRRGRADRGRQRHRRRDRRRALPIDAGARAWFTCSGARSGRGGAGGGEDYELLFAVPPRRAAAAARVQRAGRACRSRAIGVADARSRASCCRGRRRRGPLARGLRTTSETRRCMLQTRAAASALAEGAAAHPGHAAPHRRGLRSRRVLRVFAVPRPPHACWRWCCAFALGLNRVAVLLGVYSNLPWIIAPYYAVRDRGRRRTPRPRAAAATFGRELSGDVRSLAVRGDFWRGATVLKPLFWPYMLVHVGAPAARRVAYRADPPVPHRATSAAGPADAGSESCAH